MMFVVPAMAHFFSVGPSNHYVLHGCFSVPDWLKEHTVVALGFLYFCSLCSMVNCVLSRCCIQVEFIRIP